MTTAADGGGGALMRIRMMKIGARAQAGREAALKHDAPGRVFEFRIKHLAEGRRRRRASRRPISSSIAKETLQPLVVFVLAIIL
jgi:hypothetical protein